VVQYVQGTATDAPTIAPGPVMHSCPSTKTAGLRVWACGKAGLVSESAGQELGRPVSVWVPVWVPVCVPCACMNCSQLHASQRVTRHPETTSSAFFYFVSSCHLPSLEEEGSASRCGLWIMEDPWSLPVYYW
jgi:hypothetical protein